VNANWNTARQHSNVDEQAAQHDEQVRHAAEQDGHLHVDGRQQDGDLRDRGRWQKLQRKHFFKEPFFDNQDEVICTGISVSPA